MKEKRMGGHVLCIFKISKDQILQLRPPYPELLKPKGSVPRSGGSGTIGQVFG